MAKRVHFAPTNLVYSPIPSTPSPALSISSLPSSSAPVTPPPFHGIPSPYSCSPLRQLPRDSPAHAIRADIPTLIHSLLASSHNPPINYDLSLPPSSIVSQYPSHSFSEPATEPPLPFFTVECPHFSWPIPVVPNHGPVVTVLDVLTAIYRNLRLPVHPVEYGSLSSIEATQKVNAAYANRYRRIRDASARQEEEQKGVKRIDFLMGENRFLGLSSTRKSPDVWELDVSH